MILKNLKKVLFKKKSLIATFLWIFTIVTMFYHFQNYKLTIWNLGFNFYIIEISLDFFIAILFWLFVWASIYKITYFSSSNNKNTFIWWIWWFFWVLVNWCPSCSITLASYLWLTSILSVFPFYWIELKFLSFFMLLYVVYDILNNLEVCKIKKH